MSEYSTLRITRSKAQAVILSNFIDGLNDSNMRRTLEMLLKDRLYNVQIVDDGEPNDDWEI